MQNLNQWMSPQAIEFMKGSTFLIAAGATLLIFTLAWCRIFAKAGYSSMVGLLMLVPVVNVLMLFVLAFLPWPKERELKALRRVQQASRRADEVAYRRAA